MASRELLNDLKWNPCFDFSEVEIWYLHRDPDVTFRVLRGDQVLCVGKSFLETSTGCIPYHRVQRIIYKKKILFER